MSIETIRAIQLSHMEEELKDIHTKMQALTVFMNSPQLQGMKHINEKKMTRLIARKKVLEDKIAESLLLDIK